MPKIAREVAELQGDVSGVRPRSILPRTGRLLREERLLQLPANLTDDGGFSKVWCHFPQILDCNIEGRHDFSGQSIRRSTGQSRAPRQHTRQVRASRHNTQRKVAHNMHSMRVKLKQSKRENIHLDFVNNTNNVNKNTVFTKSKL